MVSSLINEVSRCSKVDRVQRFFLPFEAESILNIPLSYSLPEDSIMWMGNKRGVFTIKSAYYVALPLVQKSEVGDCSYSYCRTRLWKTMWQLKLPAKIRIFSWKACMDELPTRLNLARRGLNIEPSCPQCKTALESTSHALIHCEKLGVCLVELAFLPGEPIGEGYQLGGYSSRNFGGRVPTRPGNLFCNCLVYLAQSEQGSL